jgi:hypothetical protein
MTQFIRKGGPLAYQLPASLIFAPTTMALNVPTRRVLSWIFWDAAQQDLWPNCESEPAPITVRRHRDDIRTGIGREASNDYRAVHAGLRMLAQTRFVFEVEGENKGIPILEEVAFLHRGNVEYVVSPWIAELHWRPLKQYALVNLDHIRQLSQPLDHLIYEHACLVAQMRRPEFTLRLWRVAEIANVRSESWSSVKDPLLGACRRVAAAVGAQFRVIAWCAGDMPCNDTFRIMPQRLGSAAPPKRQPRSQQYLIDAHGVRPAE